MTPKLKVIDQSNSTTTKDGIGYICITDIARCKNPNRTGVIIGNWLRNRNTIEFLGIWVQLNDTDFPIIELDVLKKTSAYAALHSPKKIGRIHSCYLPSGGK